MALIFFLPADIKEVMAERSAQIVKP